MRKHIGLLVGSGEGLEPTESSHLSGVSGPTQLHVHHLLPSLASFSLPSPPSPPYFCISIPVLGFNCYRLNPPLLLYFFTMEWQPQEEPLGQLAYCLRDSLNSYNSAAQKQAEQVCRAFVFNSNCSTFLHMTFGCIISNCNLLSYQACPRLRSYSFFIFFCPCAFVCLEIFLRYHD